jgi:hypothetical protein
MDGTAFPHDCCEPRPDFEALLRDLIEAQDAHSYLQAGGISSSDKLMAASERYSGALLSARIALGKATR